MKITIQTDTNSNTFRHKLPVHISLSARGQGIFLIQQIQNTFLSLARLQIGKVLMKPSASLNRSNILTTDCLKLPCSAKAKHERKQAAKVTSKTTGLKGIYQNTNFRSLQTFKRSHFYKTSWCRFIQKTDINVTAVPLSSIYYQKGWLSASMMMSKD